MKTIRNTGLIVAAVALLVSAVPASATEVTRSSYREAVEPICKVNTAANERIFKGVKTMVKKGKLKQAAARFIKASAALKRALVELKEVPQPVADQERLAKWLGYIATEANLFQKAGKKLRAGNRPAAQKVVSQLTKNANLANGLVVGFEFHYCKLEPSRFT